MIRILNAKEAEPLARRRAVRLSEAEEVVAPIIEDVRRSGDEALITYARRFDGLEGSNLAVGRGEMRAAQRKLTREFLKAADTAAQNIRSFAERQLPRPFSMRLPDGQRVGQVIRPLDTVAAYIPAGRYPLPSTLLMTVIPAEAAGVHRICVACPRPSPEILGLAGRLGVSSFYRAGGAHAIAAFAFGTATVPRADRIVGPGSVYVAAAKKLLAGEVAIDFIAGPTETVLIAVDGDPRVVAADMLAQAEHDVEASAVLLTTSRRFAAAVAAEIDRQLDELPTAAVARPSIEQNGAIVVFSSVEQAVKFANRLAPEHLSIPDARWLDSVESAGCVFIGPQSAEAAGDYACGPNHVLPTAGVARQRGGLSSADFVKVITTQELSPRALKRLAPAITTLARAEGLEAHARSIEVRTNG
jgi:histidinol dehydrogenase